MEAGYVLYPSDAELAATRAELERREPEWFRDNVAGQPAIVQDKIIREWAKYFYGPTATVEKGAKVLSATASKWRASISGAVTAAASEALGAAQAAVQRVKSGAEALRESYSDANSIAARTVFYSNVCNAPSEAAKAASPFGFALTPAQAQDNERMQALVRPFCTPGLRDPRRPVPDYTKEGPQLEAAVAAAEVETPPRVPPGLEGIASAGELGGGGVRGGGLRGGKRHSRKRSVRLSKRRATKRRASKRRSTKRGSSKRRR